MRWVVGFVAFDLWMYFWHRANHGVSWLWRFHRVHHSDIPVETNSNYAGIFSFWDRIWGTYRQREVASIRYGLMEFREPRRQTLRGLLLTPMV